MSRFNLSFRTHFIYLAVILVCISLTNLVSAQTNKGGISGTVTDQQGAVVAGATVMITNVGTNQSVKLTTSESGTYSASLLDPVVYTIVAEATGFKKAIIQNVKVDTASITSGNIILEVGSETATVTVEADAPLVNVEDGAAGGTISNRQIVDLPLGDRFVLGLALTIPNVSGQTTTEEVGLFQTTVAPGAGLNVNGSRPGETTFLADGANNTGVGIARAVVNFSPDTVQEFKVSTSNFSAEYGGTGGGIVNVTTKSGTNNFRGSIGIFHRNPSINASPFTDSAVRGKSFLRQTNGTITVGGPIYLPRFGEGGPKLYNGKNRTFFFVAYEPKWRSDKLLQSALVPTAAQIAGDFRDLVSVNSGGSLVPASVAAQFGLTGTPVFIYQQAVLVGNQLRPITLTGTNRYCQFGATNAIQTATGPQCATVGTNTSLNVIPTAYLDPISQRILREGMPPAGDYFLDNGNIRNLAYYRGSISNSKPLTVRIDHRLTEKNSLNFRFTDSPNFGERPRGTFGDSTINQFLTDYSKTRQILIGDTHTFTATLINDLKLSYQKGDFSSTNPPEWQTRNYSTELGLPSLTTGGLPLFNFSQGGMFNIGQNNAGAGASPQLGNRIEESFNIADTMTWVQGNKTWKFGVDLKHARMKIITVGNASGGGYRFTNALTNSGGSGATGGFDLATFLQGVPTSVDLRNAILPYYYRWNSGSIFVQNDWKIRPNLTLNLGIRYSLELPRTEKYDNQAVLRTDLATTVTLGTQTCGTVTAQLCTTAGTAAYTGLPTNLIPTSTKVPVLAFAGRGGRSRYLTPIDWNNIQPRFGFAWQPKIFGLNEGKRSVVIRGGFGISTGVLTGTNTAAAPDFAASTQTFNQNSGQTTAGFWTRLSSNPPLLVPGTLITIPSDGLISTGSVFYRNSTFTVANGKIENPSSATWSLAGSVELTKNMVVEVGYIGNRGSNLFLPPINQNSVPFEKADQLAALNINPGDLVRDPLNRRSDPNNPNSAILNVPVYSLLTDYIGFDSLTERYRTEGSSIRHAGFISLERRIGRGANFRFSYTFQKTLLDASDSGLFGDTSVGARTYSQLSFGATLKQEKAVASYNQPHVFATTFSYDIPFGKGGSLLKNAPNFVNQIIGDWKLSGIARMISGTPFTIGLFDSNRLSSLTQGANLGVVRPDIVPGVPLLNPNYNPSCQFGAVCPSYLNPAAFKRPAKGEIGNAPAALSVYAPWQRYVDLSLLKNFYVGDGRKRYFQLKVDAINVFNMREARVAGTNSFNGIWFLGYPSEADITGANYTSWANAWNALHPNDQVSNVGTTANATFNQVVAITNAPRTANAGTLPASFYSVQLPNNFRELKLGEVDLRDPNQFKIYRQRALDGAGSIYNSAWGTLTDTANPRYLQFSLKFVF
jgi:hypothetical protein